MTIREAGVFGLICLAIAGASHVMDEVATRKLNEKIDQRVESKLNEARQDPEALWFLRKIRDYQTCGTNAKTGKEKSNGKSQPTKQTTCGNPASPGEAR